VRIVIDRGHGEIPEFSPVCVYCKRLINDGKGRLCAAFPDGIPLPIWLGNNNHTKPYPGDHGIQFEPVQVPEKSVSLPT